ncbi:hypothetical protein C8R42DRAFT_129992 [Lentinula raphanica]|nr:hypothetical protein C8R42DRAFT_129992 [Lentinula raphanica]
MSFQYSGSHPTLPPLTGQARPVMTPLQNQFDTHRRTPLSNQTTESISQIPAIQNSAINNNDRYQVSDSSRRSLEASLEFSSNGFGSGRTHSNNALQNPTFTPYRSRAHDDRIDHSISPSVDFQSSRSIGSTKAQDTRYSGLHMDSRASNSQIHHTSSSMVQTSLSHTSMPQHGRDNDHLQTTLELTSSHLDTFTPSCASTPFNGRTTLNFVPTEPEPRLELSINDSNTPTGFDDTLELEFQNPTFRGSRMQSNDQSRSFGKQDKDMLRRFAEKTGKMNVLKVEQVQHLKRHIEYNTDGNTGNVKSFIALHGTLFEMANTSESQRINNQAITELVANANRTANANVVVSNKTRTRK